ncbi:Glutathione S-transferase U10-like protein [Drosera capensis]
MKRSEKVTLHGMWASPFVRLVRLALEVKGVTYEFVEEDLRNKSDTLLQYNPVHKKVPVLVHDGKPLVESWIILQYIDQTWKTTPRLLPDDLYQRARVRFWAEFILDKLLEKTRTAVKTHGTEQENVIKEVKESLKLMEENMTDLIPTGTDPSSCDLDVLDIFMATSSNIIKAVGESLNVKFMDPNVSPSIFSWMESLAELSLVKKTAPPHEPLVKFLVNLRKKFVQQPSAI